MAKRALRSPAARRSLRSRPVPGSNPPLAERPARASHIAPRQQSELFERETRAEADADHDEPVEERPAPAPAPAPAIDRYAAQDLTDAAKQFAARALAERPPRDPQPPLPPSAADTIASSRADHASEHDDHDHLLTDFFSSPPPEPNGAFDAPYHVSMSIGSRRAMWSAVTIFAVSLVGIAGFMVYNEWLMPTPVELGSGISGDPATAIAALAAPTPLPMIASVTSPAVEVPRHHTMHASAAPPTAAATPVTTLAVTASTAAQPAAKSVAVAVQPTPAPAAPPPSAASNQAANSVQVRGPTPQLPEARDPAASVPSFDELVDVGRSFAHRNRNEQAMKAFQEALALQPDGAPALAGMAYVQLNAGDKASAKSFAMHALNADPTSSQAWIVLGAAQEQLGERAAARASYRKCATDAVGSYVSECKQLAH